MQCFVVQRLDRLENEHTVSAYLDTATKLAASALKMFDDPDGYACAVRCDFSRAFGHLYVSVAVCRGRCGSTWPGGGALLGRDSIRREELDSMTGSDQFVFNAFYTRMRDVQRYHAKFSQSTKEAGKGGVCAGIKPDIVFSGEEAMGRYAPPRAVCPCVCPRTHPLFP